LTTIEPTGAMLSARLKKTCAIGRAGLQFPLQNGKQ